MNAQIGDATNEEFIESLNIMAIKRDSKMNLNFAPETRFIPGDTILVLGDTKNIQKCFHI